MPSYTTFDAATTRSASTHRLSPRSPRRSPNSLKQSDRTSTDRLTASVTPTTQRRHLSFPATGDWAYWSTVTRSVSLAAGTYQIRVTATGASGSNIDRLEVT